MSAIDPKTAKTFVRGMTQTARDDMLDRHRSLPVSNMRELKQSNVRKTVGAHVAKVLGNLQICSWWEGRQYHAVYLHSMAGLSSMPNHMVLNALCINTRSGHRTDRCLLRISTHALERLLERGDNVQLIDALQEELTTEFFDELFRILKAIGDAKPGDQWKLPTATGVACCVYPELDVHAVAIVMTTWYKK